MSALWNRQQHEWLQAMGYRVWRLAGDEPAPDAGPTHAGASGVAAPGDAARAAVAPVGRGPAESEPTFAPAPSPGTARRLHRSLLRATGQRTTRAAEALLARLQVDAAALRDDPAGKRALWPRLRALRKASGRR